MNVFAANDLEAADLLALARLDDDGAPAVTTATGQGAALRGQRGPQPRDSGSCRLGTGMSREGVAAGGDR